MVLSGRRDDDTDDDTGRSVVTLRCLRQHRHGYHPLGMPLIRGHIRVIKPEDIW